MTETVASVHEFGVAGAGCTADALQIDFSWYRLDAMNFILF